MGFLVLILSVATFSWILTLMLRRYALAKSIIDVPNARSSHVNPTPRGGGLAIVLVFLLSVCCLSLLGELSWRWAVSTCSSGLIIAIVGFLDDHGHIAARWRLASHFSAAALALYGLGSVPVLEAFDLQLGSMWLLYPLAAFFLVWLLNLYNFMDGIDGIASIEAITVCLSGALLYWLLGYSQPMLPLLALAAAVAGFLIWNFPPAKIFMGDAGSGFLGLTLGVLALTAGLVEPQLLWSWLILLGVFIADATWTLFRRLLRGDKVYEAHRSHAYQYASRQFGAHLPVTLAVLLINIIWLLPWAVLVALGHVDGLIGLVVAYFPLGVLAVRFKAGALESIP